MKEIPQNATSDLHLMKKVIILKKIQVTMKTIIPPIFSHFSLSLNRKKTCGNGSHGKETEHIYASATNLLHIIKWNLNWCKCGNCRNETREIDCLCCRKVDAMLTASTKIPELEGSITSSSFYWQLPDN